MLTLQPLVYIEGKDQTDRPIWDYDTGTLASWKGCYTGSHYLTQLWGSAHPCRTTRTLENFNNQGTKMILLSEKPWLIANNSKNLANRSKSIIKNNLGLCTRSEIWKTYLELWKTVMDLMVWRFAKDITN